MILTEPDISKYAPSVTLCGAALEGAVGFIQSIIESDAGCNRPIEVTEFAEKISVNLKTQTFWLSYLPVLDSPVPIVQVRVGGNWQDRYRRYVPSSQWRTLTSSQYNLDIDGQIHLDWSALHASGYSAGFGASESLYSTAQVTYSSGFDFSLDTGAAGTLKAAAGKILEFVTQNGYFKGVEELEVPFEEFRIKYADQGTKVGSIPAGLMMPFKKYQVRN